MPRTTFAYGFESKVGEFAHKICARFAPDKYLHTFLLILDKNGGEPALIFRDDSPEWEKIVKKARNEDFPHIFYEPLDDGKEYIWLGWHEIDRAAMESLIGQPFEEKDFLPLYGHRAQPLDSHEPFPESWGVMF